MLGCPLDKINSLGQTGSFIQVDGRKLRDGDSYALGIVIWSAGYFRHERVDSTNGKPRTGPEVSLSASVAVMRPERRIPRYRLTSVDSMASECAMPMSLIASSSINAERRTRTSAPIMTGAMLRPGLTLQETVGVRTAS